MRDDHHSFWQQLICAYRQETIEEREALWVELMEAAQTVFFELLGLEPSQQIDSLLYERISTAIERLEVRVLSGYAAEKAIRATGSRKKGARDRLLTDESSPNRYLRSLLRSRPKVERLPVRLSIREDATRFTSRDSRGSAIDSEAGVQFFDRLMVYLSEFARNHPGRIPTLVPWQSAVVREVAGLTTDEFTALYGRGIGGLTNQEICQLLGISDATGTRLYQSAKGKVEKAIKRRFDGYCRGEKGDRIA